jgi:hypothetical protein
MDTLVQMSHTRAAWAIASAIPSSHRQQLHVCAKLYYENDLQVFIFFYNSNHCTLFSVFYDPLTLLSYFQIMIMHWIFSIVCDRMNSNRNNYDYELARVLVTCFQQVYRLRALIRNSTCELHEVDDTFFSLENNNNQVSITIRM